MHFRYKGQWHVTRKPTLVWGQGRENHVLSRTCFCRSIQGSEVTTQIISVLWLAFLRSGAVSWLLQRGLPSVYHGVVLHTVSGTSCPTSEAEPHCFAVSSYNVVVPIQKKMEWLRIRLPSSSGDSSCVKLT